MDGVAAGSVVAEAALRTRHRSFTFTALVSKHANIHSVASFLTGKMTTAQLLLFLGNWHTVATWVCISAQGSDVEPRGTLVGL